MFSFLKCIFKGESIQSNDSVDLIKQGENDEFELVEIEIHPEKMICPDCGGITLKGLELCDKCGGEL